MDFAMKQALMAKRAVGRMMTIRDKLDASRSNIYTGRIVSCEVLPPRMSRTGMSLVGRWSVTIETASGARFTFPMAKLPR